MAIGNMSLSEPDYMNTFEELNQLADNTRDSEAGLKRDLLFDIVDFIWREMKERGWSQKECADHLRMRPSQLNRILNTDANLTASTIARVYHVFGCRPKIAERGQSRSATDAVIVNLLLVKHEKSCSFGFDSKTVAASDSVQIQQEEVYAQG